MEEQIVTDVWEFCNKCNGMKTQRAVIYRDATYLTCSCGTKKILDYDPRGRKTGQTVKKKSFFKHTVLGRPKNK